MNGNARVYKIEADENGISLFWDKPYLGFGVYTIILGDCAYNSELDDMQQEILAYSESMDCDDDKSFITELFTSVINSLKVME